MLVNGILETCIYVDDLDRAEAFYRDILGLRLISRQEGRHVFFRCGDAMLLLFDPRGSSQEGSDVPAHGAHGPSHIAFSVSEREIGDWRTRLEQHGIEIEKQVDWPQGGTSVYFRDPAGNSLEVATPRIWNGVE
jgi:catechol 2,3-dioxygenase-like lactoylglutathione lyase family enzyme